MIGRRAIAGGGPLPGFALSTGLTCAFLAAAVLLPLSLVLLRGLAGGVAAALALATGARARAALGLSLAASLVAAVLDVAAGLVVAWALARRRFPGRSILDALVDLPVALPTAVSGLALAAVYGPTGPLGRALGAAGLRVEGTAAGVVLALAFVGLPYAVRSLQPALEAVRGEEEEAARLLGASRAQTLARIVLPQLLPAALAGLGIAFARGVGEYGAVVILSGNVPGRTEVASRLVVERMGGGDEAGAAALASALLALSLALLLGIGRLQAAARLRAGGA